MVAIAAPFVAFAIWRRVGLAVWVTAIIFFVVSIVDHGDAVTAGLTVPSPDIFGGPDSSIHPALVPTCQAVIDVLILFVLTRRKVLSYYFGARSGPRDDDTT